MLTLLSLFLTLVKLGKVRLIGILAIILNIINAKTFERKTFGPKCKSEPLKNMDFCSKGKNLEVFHRFNELRVNELNSAKCHTWSNIEPDRPELGSI